VTVECDFRSDAIREPTALACGSDRCFDTQPV